MDKINYKLVNLSIIVIIFFLIFKTIDIWIKVLFFLKNIFLPIIIAFAISYSISVISKLLNKKINNLFVTNCLVLLFMLLIIFVCLYYSLPILISDVKSLSKEIIPFFNKLFIRLDFIDIEIFKETFFNIINSYLMKVNSNSIKIVVGSFSKTIIIIILSFYFLFNMDKIRNKIRGTFKHKKIFHILRNIDIALTNYLKGLFIIFFIELFEYLFIYFIFGHPYYLLLGMLAGVATLIPYFGGIFTNIIALITSFYVSKKLFIICSIITLIMPIIDSYVVDPKIFKKTNELNPLKTIIIIIICSSVFKIYGLIFAIPIYLVGEIIVKSLFVKR